MNLIDIEKRIINFWQTFNIFGKTLAKNKTKKRFVWVEGPPYANAPPHMGHFLTRIYKDSIMRFFSMIGYYVPRRAGWDTHGLPIEVVTEKTLGIGNKKEILDYGVDKFNAHCKELVMKFKDVWEKFDQQLGFWIDHKNAYVTYDPFYMESCWWILKRIYQQNLLVQKNKVAPYCPRCETVLAQAELGMPDAYRKVKDPSIYIKFKITDKDEYLLVWTTTPWTLPGNLALAVNPSFDYYLYQVENEKIWSHQKLDYSVLEKRKGRELVGLKYEPLFKIEVNEIINSRYKVYSADFVQEGEGTGIVHIAPAYGEEDFELEERHGLGVVNYLNERGEFKIDIDNLGLKGKFFKEADEKIIDYLDAKGVLFKKEIYEHDYPHCWRCKSPLIYFASNFWVIEVSKIKDRIVKNFEKTNWVPKGAGHRFYEWIKEGKDWNLSRTRFWGIPLPIWKCDKCNRTTVIGSLQELASKFKPNNTYYLMRHCWSLSLSKNFLSSYPELIFNPLTRKGVWQAKQKAKSLKKEKIDLIFTSPILRAKETALIIGDELNIPVFVDERLREIDMGILQNRPYEEFDKYIVDRLTGEKDFNKRIENGESLNDVKKRMINFVLDLERKYRNKRILIVSHGGPLLLLEGEMKGLSQNQIKKLFSNKYEVAEIRKIDLLVLPRNSEGEIDLHRPYVDSLSWRCSCGGWFKRVEEVADIWFDSGCVPFSAFHYPFENRKEIEQKSIFPNDFIIEGLDQTRGWFYTLLVISTLIKNSPPYKNVLVNGFVLDRQGKKMSKSLGNVTDPFEVMERYGSDLPRFYLFYLNEIGDNKKFDENEMIKLKGEFFDLLLNILKFYHFYYDKRINSYRKHAQLETIDIWFKAKMKNVYQEYYHQMINFNLHKASRVLVDLVGDFSRWWLRRSRKRFQEPKNFDKLASALINFQYFFFQILKMLAPLAPFTAEFLYQEVKNDLRGKIENYESIHLHPLGKPIRLSNQENIILSEMEKIREIASEVHRKRKEKGIKLRQPLQSIYLRTKFSEELLEILKDEVNVMEVKIDKSQVDEVVVDFTITPKLKEIGIFNDFIRFIQDLRQDAGLTPKEIVFLDIRVSSFLNKILKNKISNISKQTKTIVLKSPRKNKLVIAEKEFNYENFGKVRISLLR
ncbi:MAG: class I tRNA ligase family protein [Patescibacteria group bacterium]|nr:class I tRNA ligase family protein [Patescibacteria group bacterium]